MNAFECPYVAVYLLAIRDIKVIINAGKKLESEIAIIASLLSSSREKSLEIDAFFIFYKISYYILLTGPNWIVSRWIA